MTTDSRQARTADFIGGLVKAVVSGNRHPSMDAHLKKMHDLPMTSDSTRRAHGFTGQRMLVVPKPVWTRLGAHPLLHALRVTDAGFFPKAAAHLVDRPNGTPTEVIIACIHGRGRAQMGDSEIIM